MKRLLVILASVLLVACENERSAHKDVPNLEEVAGVEFENEPHGLWDGILKYQSEEELRQAFDEDAIEGVISTWHSMREVRGLE